ncbi:rRNA pseudouridine synthase [Oceanobacillus luteolus]|uniref:Pseudouridine synthase n=1 Tax=Oceanobacillus luteolus TaxID=1274358 RepID=A0ABW4HMK6_9BACI|nr:pseudouridine synthase [Oceanobacillus luteolus]MCM3742316.1 rRNA pseudouridine synthase [Oceanobacillus luteolus]
MRLDKMLSNMGIGTRKEVKAILKKKLVTVNENIVKDGSTHIDPVKDEVKVDGEVITYQKHIYLMLHKPDGVLSATRDLNMKTVIDLIEPAYQHYEIFPVGRLDKDTEGLLLLTNDGDLAHQLLSPKKNVEKTYYAHVEGKVTSEDEEKFKVGVDIGEGYITKPASLTILKSGPVSEIELTITEGKFHQVKRMFEAVGKKVVYLKRIRMGELILDPTLQKGAYRPLTKEELAYCERMKQS